MYNPKKISVVIALSFILSAVYSSSGISLKSFFTDNEIRLAVNGEFLTSVALKGKGNVSSAGIEITSPVQNSYITASFSGFDMVAVEKGFFYMDNSGANRLKIYRALTDFYSLKGMIYYSKTQGTTSNLVLDSYRIQSPDDYVRYSPEDKSIPESSFSHFAARDNRLGLVTFASELVSKGDDFIMINSSTGTSTKFGMKIFDPGDYRIYKFLIYDRKLKGYFFYGVQLMKVRSGILSRIDLLKPDSFGNRLRAEDIHFLKIIGIDRTGKLAAFR